MFGECGGRVIALQRLNEESKGEISMLDPRGLYEIVASAPPTEGAVLLYDFNGFMDAGSAGEGMTRHLLSEYEHEVLVRFDIDQLLNYRTRRPQMTFSADRWSDYEAPELVIYQLHDDNGVEFLLLTGTEPDLQWERFVAAVIGLIEQWGVKLSIGYQGIPMGTPHTRPLGVTGHATSTELLQHFDSTISHLQVPGHVAALLELRLGQQGHDAMGYAVHVPHYLSQTNHPSSSVRLLEAVASAANLTFTDEALRDTARDVDAEVDAQVQDSDEVASVVEALERQYDMFTQELENKNLLAESLQDLPSADELGAELEHFLSQQRPGSSES